MNLVYAKLMPGNFGDELNPYIWPRLFPKAFSSKDDIDFLGIGTILEPAMIGGTRRKVVFGSGGGYGKPPHIDGKWKIYFVRGPLTAKLLGIPADSAITDAAYCMGFLDESPVTPTGRVVFMPHHKSEAEVDWAGMCTELGWIYASPTASVESALELLKSAKLVITEAMHGAIVSDLYRIPWAPVRYGFRSLDFKWMDWCSSLSLEYRPVDLPPLLDARMGARETTERLVKKTFGVFGVGKKAWKATPVLRSSNRLRDDALKLLAGIAERGDGNLSPDRAFQLAKSRLWEKLEQFRSEYER